MKWIITYYDEALELKIFSLPDGILAKFIKFTEIMREFGPNIGMPHSRAMGNGLFELRLKGKEGVARVFYCTFTNQRIHFLHNFIKKTQKTPTKELRLVRERMKEVKKNGI